MKRSQGLCALILCGLLVTACASRPTPQGPPTRTWKNAPYVTGDSALAPQDAPAPGTAKFIFLRPAGDGKKESVTNVYFSDRFLTALMPGAYVVHQACAGDVKLAAAYDDASLRHEGKYASEKPFRTTAGETYYFVVRRKDGQGPAEITQIDASKLDLGRYKVQTHAISRAPRTCDGVQSAAAAPSAPVVAPPPPPVAAVVAPAPEPAGVKLCDASARGSAVANTPARLNANEVEQLRCVIESWRAAWQAGDFAAYQQHYDRDGSKSVARSKGWEAQRKQRLKNTNMKIEHGTIILEETGGMVSAGFVQKYRSDQFKDDGTKVLKFRRNADGWKIVSEGFERAGR